MIPSPFFHRLETRLRFIYKDGYKPKIADDLAATISKYSPANHPAAKWDEKDMALITYGDSIIEPGRKPLKTLKEFLDAYFSNLFSVVHILPFFPYSSDDGFAVKDFREVNPRLGGWKDIQRLTENFDLMADLVINHVSSESQWFQNFVRQDGVGADFFITESPEKDLSRVIRPRNSPLLTPVNTKKGQKYVWTTFSDDQIDLDFSNPQVLIRMVDILLHYLSHGARIIRLDAIAFLWKKPETTCLHLPETHEIVKLLREIAEFIDPRAIILTETNVPHKENLSYFGDGDEAHMVYQFSLPPLLLHALHTGNPEYLSGWAEGLKAPPRGCTFFNFTASHDGIGVRPLEGLIPEHEKMQLIENIKMSGGEVSYKSNPDGSHSPYELNITWFDAMKRTLNGADTLQVERFLTSQIIMMSFRGLPAFYIHSLTATPNYSEGVMLTGQKRTINRKKWNKTELKQTLNQSGPQKIVFETLRKLLATRKEQKAFHPDAPQEIPACESSVFFLARHATNGKQTILLIANLSDKKRSFKLPGKYRNLTFDLIQNKTLKKPYLTPYQCLWLTHQ